MITWKMELLLKQLFLPSFKRWPWVFGLCAVGLIIGAMLLPHQVHPVSHQAKLAVVSEAQTVQAPVLPEEAIPAAPEKVIPATPIKTWHPRHIVKVWRTKYRGATYQVVQLPRCEHIETLISYEPAGETLKRAKQRLGGITAMTGSFHNPQSMALADFLQRNGSVLSARRTLRYSLVIDAWGRLAISDDYLQFKHMQGVSAIALGQRLVPLEYDGFSRAFMNRVTERMGIGLSDHYIYLVTSVTTIWHFAEFFDKQLPCTIALNSDGGHVVRGKAPVHIVFRWKKASGTVQK